MIVKPVIQVKTVKLAILPISIIVLVTIVLGSFLLPQRAGRGWLMRAALSCPEQGPGEDSLTGDVPAHEQHEDCGCAPLYSGIVDEELDGDELLLAQPAFIRWTHRRERTLVAHPALSSHVIDLSRRPPRPSIA